MKINIAHSEFLPQQKGGLMICGYEWGYSKEDQEVDAKGVNQTPVASDVACTFANKELRYGPLALQWRYDAIIKKWFKLWEHPLSETNPSDFEKSIIQTNWCDTMGYSMNGDYSKLNDASQINNFIYHIDYFKPRILLLMGSRLIEALQNPSTLNKFKSIMGNCISPPLMTQKPFKGRRFKVTFQSFEKCRVVCFPHPSSSRGISDDYIRLFADEMNNILACYKRELLASGALNNCDAN